MTRRIPGEEILVPSLLMEPIFRPRRVFVRKYYSAKKVS